MNRSLIYPPIVGVSGQSNSGKTLLIERMVPLLRKRGARVAVVKHCTHRIEADTPGKDSDRIFKAGADVLAAGPSESFARFYGEKTSLWQAVRRVAAGCDVCLVEGYRGHDIPRIRVARPENDGPVEEACGAGYPTRERSSRGRAHHAATADFTNCAENSLLQQRQNILFTVTDSLTQVEDVEKIVWDLVEHSHRALPVMGLIIPDTSDSSEGTAADEIKRIASALAPHVQRVFVSGKTLASSNLVGIDCLSPAPGAEMPLAGILSAMRWHPAARWVVVQGDSPGVESRTVKKLLSHVRIGVDAVLPQAENPLAVYEPTCLPRFEIAALEGITSPMRALDEDRVARANER